MSKAAGLETVYKVDQEDLPISCPRPDAPAWNLHPRVYLYPGDDGLVECPYCGTKYQVDRYS